MTKIDLTAEGTRSNGGVEPAEIHRLEEALGVTFCSALEEHLEMFGAGMINYCPFYGVSPNCDPLARAAVNLYNQTLIGREYGLQGRFVIIADAAGESFVVDCESEQGAVYVWNPALTNSDPEELEYVSESFTRFVDKVVAGDY